MGSNYNRCIRVAVLFLSSIVVYMQLVQHRATKGLTSLLIFLQISLFLVKVLIIKPIYTCFSEHVVTLAHLISIIHLPPPVVFFFFLNLFSSLTKTPALARTHTRTAHTANTYIENTPKAFSVCDAATGARTGCKQQGVWKRRGRCVGRPYAFHQGLMKTHAHTLNHTQYCHIKKKINKKK